MLENVCGHDRPYGPFALAFFPDSIIKFGEAHGINLAMVTSSYTAIWVSPAFLRRRLWILTYG